jgi:hypothetical protein
MKPNNPKALEQPTTNNTTLIKDFERQNFLETPKHNNTNMREEFEGRTQPNTKQATFWMNSESLRRSAFRFLLNSCCVCWFCCFPQFWQVEFLRHRVLASFVWFPKVVAFALLQGRRFFSSQGFGFGVPSTSWASVLIFPAALDAGACCGLPGPIPGKRQRARADRIGLCRGISFNIGIQIDAVPMLHSY